MRINTYENGVLVSQVDVVDPPLTPQQIKAKAVDDSIATLRQWANDARATTVTSGNAVATLQVVVTRLGTFFDRFADLVESQR